MTALRVLPPTHYVGAVEAMDEIARVRAAAARRRRGLPGRRRRLLPGRGGAALRRASPATTADTMLALSAERGGDPERPGKKDPLDPLLWRAARPGEPSWDSPARPRPAGLARRVRGDRARPARRRRSTCRAAAPTSSSRTTRCPPRTPRCSTGTLALRHGLRARRHGRARRREDEQVPRQPGLRQPAARAPGVDPGALRLALLSAHYRTDREWTGALLTAGQERLAAWRARRRRGRRARPAPRCWPRSARRSPTTSTRPAALAAVDAWARGRRARTPRRPALVRDAVDALLGVAPLTAFSTDRAWPPRSWHRVPSLGDTRTDDPEEHP